MLKEPLQNSPTTSDYDDEYATCAATYATLRIYTGELDPSTVTRALGLKPNQVLIKGEQSARLNGWLLSSQNLVKSRDVRRHVDWLLQQVSESRLELIKSQSEAEIWMDVFCYWRSMDGHGGPSLSSKQMRTLAELNLNIGFDCY